MTGTTDLAAVWTATTDELADEIISAQQRAYLRLTRLRAIVEDTALLSVPDAFTRDVIESRLRPAITEALTRRLGRPIQVAVTVRVPDDGSGRPAGTVYRSVPEPGPADHDGGPPGYADAGYDGLPGQRDGGDHDAGQSPLIPEQAHPRRRPDTSSPGDDGHRPDDRDGQEALFSTAFAEPPRPDRSGPLRHPSERRSYDEQAARLDRPTADTRGTSRATARTPSPPGTST